jgi:predicted transcriptional regulator
MAGVKRGTLRYHLILLKLGQKIMAHEASGSIHYFTNSGLYSDPDKTVITYLWNTTDRRIYQLLMENSEVTRKEIGNDLGLSVSTVSWRMKRLSDDKIIWIRKTGKNVRYGICPDVRQYLEKYLMPNRETVQITPMEQIRESA